MKRSAPIARKTRLRSGPKAELKRSARLKDTPLERTSKLTRSRLRAPGTPARTDQGTPKRTRRGWNSTLRPVSPKTGGHRFPKRRDIPFCRYVRGLPCAAAGRRADSPCWGRVQAAHVCGTTRGAGAYDRGEVAPLCEGHHSEEQGRTARFERKYGLDLAAIAAALPTRYEREAA